MTQDTPMEAPPRSNPTWVRDILKALHDDGKTGADIMNIAGVLVGEGFAITVSEKMGERSMTR